MPMVREYVRTPRLEPLEPRRLLATYSLAEVPALIAYHSNPQAAAKLHLDFDGDFTRRWAGRSPRETPAYTVDGDAFTFTDEEIANVREITRRVVEKYSPFNLDVTTEDPGNRNNNQTFSVVVGGDGRWFSRGRRSRGEGVAYVNSFSNAGPNVAWVFSALRAWNVQWAAENVAHEAGHGFGLKHQRSRLTRAGTLVEYYGGAGDRSPIMGGSSNAADARGVWWRTVRGSPQRSPDRVRDEMAILSGRRNGFGYRPDDHGNSPAAASPLDPAAAAAGLAGGAGVIETTADEDWFAFTTPGGSRTFEIRPSPDGGMLDATATLRDSAGTVITTADTASPAETLTAEALAPGTYYVAVSSAMEYGDVGQYTVHDVTAPPTPTPTPPPPPAPTT